MKSPRIGTATVCVPPPGAKLSRPEVSTKSAPAIAVPSTVVYSTATRTALPLSMVLGAITSALWPRVVSADPAGTLRLLKRALSLGAVAAAGGVVYALLAPFVMPLLFGEAFATQTPVPVVTEGAGV